ncbi:MAG: hypothetical protein ACJ78Q_07830 [Chloroflexia bacterium]
MAATDVAQATNLQIPRVIKCPTPQCPGWITLDSTRHQTEPCRYCRISVDTLRFLLSRVGAEHKALPPQVHDEFNRLMLAMAGAWGRNVYLRPSTQALVDLSAGTRGVTIEYNPALGAAGLDGAAPLVGTILHKLLHFEAHLGQRIPQLSVRSAARDKQGLSPLLSYLLTVADHAWVALRLGQLYPLLYGAQSRWGLDLAQMLAGSESMFNRYLSERNLKKLLAVLQDAGEDAGAFRTAVMQRLAMLTSQVLDHEREETRKIFLAVQLANARLLNADAYPDYQSIVTASGLPDVREALTMADRLYTEMNNAASESLGAAAKGQDRQALAIDPGLFHRALEGGIRALGMANYFEIK